MIETATSNLKEDSWSSITFSSNQTIEIDLWWRERESERTFRKIRKSRESSMKDGIKRRRSWWRTFES